VVVEGRYGLAFTGAGEEVVFGVQGQRVVLNEFKARPDGQQIVLRWLQHRATAILAARRHKAAKGKVQLTPTEEEGVLPKSFEGLVAYSGLIM
jgi:hypothetical protein